MRCRCRRRTIKREMGLPSWIEHFPVRTSQALRAKAGLRHPASASLSLASCWPLPQQLLPVSAAGGGRRRCPQKGSHWQAGPLPTGRPRPDVAQKGGPCCRGQQLLDNAPCQAAVNRGSRALLFSKYRALLVPRGLDRLASASPFGGNNDDRRQRRKQEVVVGAAASKTQVLFKARSGCWEPQPGCGIAKQ